MLRKKAGLANYLKIFLFSLTVLSMLYRVEAKALTFDCQYYLPILEKDPHLHVITQRFVVSDDRKKVIDSAGKEFDFSENNIGYSWSQMLIKPDGSVNITVQGFLKKSGNYSYMYYRSSDNDGMKLLFRGKCEVLEQNKN